MNFRSAMLGLVVFALAGWPALMPATAAAPAPTIVKVSLSDSSVDPSMKMMMIKPDVDFVKTGVIAFDVTNESKSLVHEMLVVSVTDQSAPLPYDARKDRVIESKIKSLGETSDMKPGAKKTLRLTLKPGKYLLLCNQTGHYHNGMSAPFTVTP